MAPRGSTLASLAIHSRHLALALCLSLFAVTAFAAEDRTTSSKAVTIADTWSLPGLIGGGLKGNDAYVDGSFFLTVPAWSTLGRDGTLGGDTIFLEPYVSWGEQGEVAVSLGVGWRHLFCGQSLSAVTHHDGHQASFFEEGAYIGANLFVDMLDTQFDNRFWQLGFGVEAGTRYLEARANCYLPLSDRQLAEEIRTETFLGNTTQSTLTEPYGTGHSVVQDFTRTTYSHTLEQLFRRFEDGMEGWDAELALLLPWIDRWMDVKLIGGYYSFDNQPFGPQRGGTGNVAGWKAGLEVRPVPAVVVNATWYEDERLTGEDWTAGLRLEIPFEAGDLGDGKGFWSRIGDAFRPRRRHLVERMAEPVHRQNAAIKVASGVEEDKSERHIVTRVISRTKGRIVLADSIVFVDNAIGSDANPGTYEAPAASIQHGENLGNMAFGDNAIVFVQGRPVPYTEIVTISQGVRLIGSSVGLPLRNGARFHGRTHTMPLVDGGFTAVNIPGLVEINGFSIRPGTDNALFSHASVFFENVSRGIIANNVFRLPGLAIVPSLFIGVNTFGNNVSQMLIANNTFPSESAFGGMIGLQMVTSDAASLTAVIAGNTIGRSYIGIHLFTEDNARSDFTIVGNTITNAAFPGLDIDAVGNAVTNITLSGNTFTFNSELNSLVDLFPQIGAEASNSAVINFIGTGTQSNTVIKIPGDTDPLYEAATSGGTITGSILINGLLHPAALDLP
jgi:hypothetical protein